MAHFQTSTHRTKWIFTPQELMEKYKVANKRAAQSVKLYGTASLEIDADGSFSHPRRQRDSESNGDRHSSVKPLKVDDERILHAFYENKIPEVCRAFSLPHKIQGTALIYYKRFYLCWSVMEHDPTYIMFTCVYLACKIEENHVTSEDLVKCANLKHELILDNEMLVLQSLGFDLIVYSPYRSIQGFIDDMEDFCYSTGGQIDLLKDLLQMSISEADRAMITDAPLLFPPAQLALAALRRANNVLRVLDFERYVQSILSRQDSTHTLSELNQAFDGIDNVISTKSIDAEQIRRAAKKLKSYQDAGSDDGSRKREKKSKRKSHRNPQEAEATPSAVTK